MMRRAAPAISPRPPAPDSRRSRAVPPRPAPRSPRPAGSWRPRSGSRPPACARPAPPPCRSARQRPRVNSAMAAAIGSAMPTRQPLPRLWLMTDERQGDGLLDDIASPAATARGSCSATTACPKRNGGRLFERVRAAHDGLLLLAGSAEQADAWGADGSHGREPARVCRSAPAHDLTEIRAAEARRRRAFSSSRRSSPTRSHRDREALGHGDSTARAANLAAGDRVGRHERRARKGSD